MRKHPSKSAPKASRSASEREECAKQALALLGVDQPDRHLLHRIKTVFITQIDWRKTAIASGRFGTMTKAHKHAAEQVAAALRKLQSKLASPDLVDDIWLDFPLDDIDFARWIKYADDAANKKLNAVPRGVDQAKLYAAAAALRLLKDRRIAAPLTRGGKFDRLAAILYGATPGALGVDFLHHCRLAAKAYKNRPSSRALQGGTI